ncbi:uncharacterized protein M6B38_121850 [Iris pallida]|uniref:Uncharacterized protein n=1 Tax=Iris pallida TaxID=29817 RepID=A0AAX6H9F5_IRIPA|nr:uncharacterized protein M6B38_121850 [Iris pallida]
MYSMFPNYEDMCLIQAIYSIIQKSLLDLHYGSNRDPLGSWIEEKRYSAIGSFH